MSSTYRIFVFFFLLVLGFLLANIMQIIIPLIAGISLKSLSENGINALAEGGMTVMRTSIFASQLFSIFLPAVLFGWYTERKKMLQYFRLIEIPSGLLLIVSLVFLFVGMPLVGYSYQLNAFIPLPDWMVSMEESTALIMKELIRMDHFLDFLFNILLIAVLAGVGEELLFRGIVQNELSKWLRNPHVAILLASLIFSAFHIQFEGFLPRMVLGLILGYAYHITKLLWVPIFMHFINNATPIASLYLFEDDLNTLDPANAPSVSWWAALLSLAGLLVLAKLLLILRTRNESERL